VVLFFYGARMSSRFTETEKWKDKWFRSLSVEGKLLWNYLCDNCDMAGFWIIDLEDAALKTGISEKNGRSLEGAWKELQRGLLEITPEEVWVKNFLYHQNNLPLNPNNPCHKGILKIINKHNGMKSSVFSYLAEQGASKGLQSPTSKSKSNGNGKSKEEPKRFPKFGETIIIGNQE
jgi:hypothetical protein